MFAFPLRSGAVRLGVLVLHRVTAGPLPPERILDALVLADVVLTLLLDEQTSTPGDPARWLGDGDSLGRAEVHQATGMVSVQLGVGVDQALLRLRAHAYAQELPILEVARAVVNRTLRFALESDPNPA
jgi:hypothetical protein